jgi:hypothetical protein
MKDRLAEQLLAKVLGWDEIPLAEERAYLEHMASYKYDSYQQFGPGKKFLECLAMWLEQFKTTLEREVAYRFVKNRLVFISSFEMEHLVRSTFTDRIRPLLIELAADESSERRWAVRRIMSGAVYTRLLDRSLFLGMSDGAHIDVFRRSTGLPNRHFHVSHEFNEDRATKLLDELVQHSGEDALFETIFLVDDFIGSGTSYLRQDGGSFEGKIWNFAKTLRDGGGLISKINKERLKIIVVSYLMTRKAKHNIERLLPALPFPGRWRVISTELIDDENLLDNSKDAEFLDLCRSYYDPKVETESMKKGGTKAIYGFSDGRLPLVLGHNTPNNAPFVIWADPQDYAVRGLFRRVERHKQ